LTTLKATLRRFWRIRKRTALNLIYRNFAFPRAHEEDAEREVEFDVG
jgi:hypothetical protein